MKYFKILSILMLSIVISFYGCKYNTNADKQESGQSQEVSNTPTQPNAAAAEPAQNAAGVWHFTCPKGCAGGAGAAGNCATCGGPLAHNAAYHDNANSMPMTTPSSPSATPPAVEPAQNAAGVWHFTCPKGCAGGAGTAGNCTTCGGPLAHNAAYHQ
jgi:hypothetical protein